ncbi:LysR family transcriptional regulator [Pseudogulbenkiania sp. MAI-1]|uniref:LysR family transcriptional regulator n=1 Tax=Pseudogulbenkiania sp. MAI-1 TaxID=990370 RepID=UPI00045E9A81|nr:LysR family transcriptional regulator [Pseudogulbenkiania sp. MAI-1]
MNQLEAMQIFVRVAELASFTRAAQSAGLPKASVSTAVQRLESLLGTRLLHRTTRKVQMTQDGQVFYERCKALLADMDELQTLFQRAPAALEGRLRVDMSIGIARNIVVPRLPEFLQAHPRIEVELSSTDRRVDLVQEGFDCVLRVGRLADSSLIARPLGQFRLLNCVSPAYLAAFGTPHTLEELAAHRLVHYVPTLGGKSPGLEYVDSVGEVRFVPMAGVLTVNNSEAYLAACLAGLGLIQVPEPGVRELLVKGELVEVLPDYRAAPMPVSLLYANRHHLPRRVRVFMDWVEEVMRPFLVS